MVPPSPDGFRVVGFVASQDEASALDAMAQVASLLARLSRAAQVRREA